MTSPPKERRPRSVRPDQGGHLDRKLREAVAGGEVCAACYGYFTPEDWDNRHTDSNGEDTPASCCTVDERPHTGGAG